jgi:membrane protease YdiL (CAAX protease family)
LALRRSARGAGAGHRPAGRRARAGYFGALVGFERQLVAGWSRTDALTVAIAAGIAEEALTRGFLQQWWGWLPANLLFGLLHAYPKREAIAWPFAAFGIGCAFASAALHWGVPAAMAAHAIFNAVSLEELRRSAARDEDASQDPQGPEAHH